MILERDLRSLHPAFSAYLRASNRDLPRVARTLREPYGEVLAVCRDYHGFLDWLIGEKDVLGGCPDALPLLLGKVAMSAAGVYGCLRDGLRGEALEVLRALAEAAVTIKVIVEKDVEARSQLYVECAQVRMWQHVRQIERTLAQPDLDDRVKQGLSGMLPSAELRSQMEAEYERLKDHYGPGRPLHWAWQLFKDEPQFAKAPVSVSRLFEQAGCLDHYHGLYHLSSELTHASAFSYSTQLDQFGLRHVGPIFDGLTAVVAWWTVQIAHKAVGAVIMFTVPQDADQLVRYSETFEHRVLQAVMQMGRLGVGPGVPATAGRAEGEQPPS